MNYKILFQDLQSGWRVYIIFNMQLARALNTPFMALRVDCIKGHVFNLSARQFEMHAQRFDGKKRK